VPPALTCAEVDGDETGTALEGAVGDVRHALTAGRDVGSEVEPHIVEIRVSRSDSHGEDDCLKDSVVAEIDAY